MRVRYKMNTKQKAVLITCFEAYENRIYQVEEVLRTRGYDTVVLLSDFRHFNKKRREKRPERAVFVSTLPYSRNISIARLRSHYQFARDAFHKVEALSPDLIYIAIPANSLARQASKYKKKFPSVKLIFDIIDLWPESLPMHGIEKTLPCKIWQNFRDVNLKNADFVFTECKLFQERLKKPLSQTPSEVLYLSREVKPFHSNLNLPKDQISLAYLGSINNIIDIPRICMLVQELACLKPVSVHVIGNGESREEFLNGLEASGASVIYHEEVYDIEKKQSVFDQCHFGLNIMKDSVCVGLTMKSIDYFEAGLPIINGILGDTSYFTDTFNVGINYGEDAAITAMKIKSLVENYDLGLRNNSRALFLNKFSKETFKKGLLDGLDLVER